VARSVEPKAVLGLSNNFAECAFGGPGLLGTALPDAHPPNESDNAANADALANFNDEIWNMTASLVLES
jgi:hypothetical protein